MACRSLVEKMGFSTVLTGSLVDSIQNPQNSLAQQLAVSALSSSAEDFKLIAADMLTNFWGYSQPIRQSLTCMVWWQVGQI